MRLIQFKLYRRLRCFFGACSFVRISKSGRRPSYALLWGNHKDVSNSLYAVGFKEEWPKK